MSSQTSPKQKPRERILETACTLFRRHGLKGIGVEAIAEAADTNKMTLYRHFGSKDELISECLREIGTRKTAIWSELEAAHPGDALAQLHAWIRMAADIVLADERGCDLANAAVELAEQDHPARKVIQDMKVAYRERLVALCAAAGLREPEMVADALSLLVEGARINRQSIGATGPAANFIAVAESIVTNARR